jgi:hypothetical protein
LRRFLITLALSVSLLLVGLMPSMATAAPAHTDVMFVFDTTGSMSEALSEATEEIEEAMTSIRGELPDVDFGLAEMRDYTEVVNPGFFEYDNEEVGFGYQPWTLLSPIGAAEGTIKAQLSTLSAKGGGDGPEAYGRGLYESAQNPAVGWRSGARGVIILVADNVPHDNELNEGIPPEFWYEEPFETGIDPGIDNVVGTVDDLDFQSTVLPTLIADGRPLEFVDYHGQPEYLPYWQNWAARTGGNALEAGLAGGLAAQLTTLVVAGANAPLPSCPAGTARDASEHCVTSTPPAGPPPPPPPAPPAPSSSFSVVPRISCAGVCHVVLVQVTFDSAGNVVMESIIPGGAGALSRATQAGVVQAKAKKPKPKAKPLVQRISQQVKAGANSLTLKLTAAGIAKLNKQGHLVLKLKVTFTPTGGSAKTSIVQLTVTPKPKGKGKH